jgi:hypothetical protein
MTITVTNRELLRNYKSLKDRLMRGEITQVKIKLAYNTNMVLKMEKKSQTAFEKSLELIAQNKTANIHIERPDFDLFDYV